MQAEVKLFTISLPLQEELGLLQPARRRQYAARLPSDVIAKQMMGLRLATEVDSTAQIQPSTSGFPGDQ